MKGTAGDGQTITANNNQTEATKPKNDKAAEGAENEGFVSPNKAVSNDLIEKLVSSKAPDKPNIV